MSLSSDKIIPYKECMYLAGFSSRTFFEKFFQPRTIEHAFNLNRDEEDKPKMHVLEEIPSKQNIAPFI